MDAVLSVLVEIHIYFTFEAIEAARANGCCEFTLVDPRHRAGA